jgi:hypothetical protein
MRWLGAVLPLLGLAGCGRTTLLLPANQTSTDAEPEVALPRDATAPDQPPPDAFPSDPPAPDFRTTDLPLPDRLPTDTFPTDQRLPDAAAPTMACSALLPLANLGLLTSQRTREVTFAPDRSWIVLRVRQEAPPGIGYPDQLVRVSLPGGELSLISSAGGLAEPLGRQGGLLVIGADGSGQGLAVYEHGGLRTLASNACGHLASPDGTRLYVVRDCGSDSRGTLEVIDVANGKATTLGSDVYAPYLSVSTSGRWFAFVAWNSASGTGADTVRVADAAGQTYEIASQPVAGQLGFVADDLLLFVTNGNYFYPSYAGSLRGHVPGSGDTSYLVASGRGLGFFGYKVSPDHRWLLAAGMQGDASFSPTADLYAIRLDGSSEQLLSANLVAYWGYEMALDAFAWSGDGTQALFLTSKMAGVWTSDPSGTSTRQISTGGTFRVAPLGDQVALIERAPTDNRDQLRLFALGTGSDVATFDGGGSLSAPNFTSDGKGLLFMSIPASGPRELRYLSALVPDSVLLGEWTETLLSTATSSGQFTPPYGLYPVDPTGCFTIVDTDLAPGPGTRLVLLPE